MTKEEKPWPDVERWEQAQLDLSTDPVSIIDPESDQAEMELSDTVVIPSPEVFELVGEADPNEAQVPFSRYSRAFLQKVYEYFERGATVATVCKALDVPRYTAREWQARYRNGTFMQMLERKSKKHARYGDKMRDHVRYLRVVCGKSYNEISNMTGINRATIRTWLKGISRIEEKNKPDVAKRSVPRRRLQAMIDAEKSFQEDQ